MPHRLETQAAAEGATAEDFDLGFFRVRQAAREPGGAFGAAPHGLSGPGVAAAHVPWLPCGPQVGRL